MELHYGRSRVGHRGSENALRLRVTASPRLRAVTSR